MTHRTLLTATACSAVLFAGLAAPAFAESNVATPGSPAAHVQAESSAGPVWLIQADTAKMLSSKKVYSLDVAAFSMLADMRQPLELAYFADETDAQISENSCVEAGYLKLSRYQDENKTCAFRAERDAKWKTQHLGEPEKVPAAASLTALGDTGPVLGN